MRLTLFYAAILLLSTRATYGQEVAAINAALDKISLASTKGDISQLLQSTSPRLIKAMGGIEQAQKLIQEGYSTLEKQGVKIDSTVNYHKREVLSISDIAYCTIPHMIIMRIPDTTKRMLALTIMMAIKEKDESTWTFLDCNQLNDEKAAILLPEFKGKAYPKVPDFKPILITKEEVNQVIEQFFSGLDQLIEESNKNIENQ